jgi:hypothetical protein
MNEVSREPKRRINTMKALLIAVALAAVSIAPVMAENFANPYANSSGGMR